jgi:hypothetical protein
MKGLLLYILLAILPLKTFAIYTICKPKCCKYLRNEEAHPKNVTVIYLLLTLKSKDEMFSALAHVNCYYTIPTKIIRYSDKDGEITSFSSDRYEGEEANPVYKKATYKIAEESIKKYRVLYENPNNKEITNDTVKCIFSLIDKIDMTKLPEYDQLPEFDKLPEYSDLDGKEID